MARQVQKLTARRAASEISPGRHSDGGGLYLNVTDTGARSWLFIWKRGGKRREMGLGSFRDVPLAKARKLAADARQQLSDGHDPLSKRNAIESMTFGEAADALIESMSPTWRNQKHRDQWKMTLKTYCAPLRPLDVSGITTDDVLRVLSPIWREKPETAIRIRGRIERVLDFAKARGRRQGENVARWRGHLDALLPRRPKLSRGHFKALPFAEMPGFVGNLRQMEGVAALALEFAILTAARSGEVLKAKWSEIDTAAKVWIVPAMRMKGGREHRVPLSDRALAILEEIKPARVSDYVFPGRRADQHMSDMSLTAVLRRGGVDATTHGFRSAFRDWGGECTVFPRELMEAALAHLVGDEVERAYRRGDALERRRELMTAWAKYCDPNSAGGNVVPIRGAAL